ncbi:hypothetical protein JT306_13940 [Salmonella enterica subsp. enterica serovar Kentucky]|nr:hypothetical protein [Salmonella enterica subsp. enterica serovar Kentucky]
MQTRLDLTEQLLETGVDSIAIKDMSGILTPMAAYELVSEIKNVLSAPAPALSRHHRDGGDGPAEGYRGGRRRRGHGDFVHERHLRPPGHRSAGGDVGRY